MRRSGLLIIAVWPLSLAALGSDLDEFKVKREPVFEFAERPKVVRRGDQVTITFASKGCCDATVAIETARGEILRHLACGVLGKHVPPPFQKGPLKQTVIWDGKDDRGRYIDNKDALTVRVSLGLKPQFERTLRWSPHRRIDWHVPLFCAAPEGVYVLDDRGYAHLRLFDHKGNYVRTVYPFPRHKIGEVGGLKWATFPQTGERLPFKAPYSKEKNVLLTSGDHPYTRRYWFAKQGWAATAMAVRGKHIALAQFRLNRLATDGSSGGLPLEGPWVAYGRARQRRGVGRPFRHEDASRIDQRANCAYWPGSAAFGPDGKWLYLTGFYRTVGIAHGGLWQGRRCLHGVVRLAFAEDKPPRVFLGDMDRKGSKPGEFCMPTSVDCDANGHIYVSDYVNDRLQVFDSAGWHLETIAVKKPMRVRVHRKSGELYVFSWMVTSRLYPAKTVVKPTLTVFGPAGARARTATHPLPYADQDRWQTNSGFQTRSECAIRYSAEMDSWADPPTIWIAAERVMGYGMSGWWHKRSPWRLMGIRIYTLRGGRWVQVRDFAEEARRKVAVVDPPKHWVQFPLFNPKTRTWYIANGGSLGNTLWRLDVETDQATRVSLPFNSNETVFGPGGLAHLKNEAVGIVGRWNLKANREVPFDYGVKRKAPRGNGTTTILSALTLPYPFPDRHTESKWEGMSVSPNGSLAVAFDDKPPLLDRKTATSVHAKADRQLDRVRIYPGRQTTHRIAIWDRYGKLVNTDAVPGIGRTWHLEIDRHGMLYVLAAQARVLDGKPYFIKNTCTLVKVDPARVKVLSSGKRVPIPMARRPDRPQDVVGHWVEGAEWFYGGVGFHPHGTHCGSCINGRFALDQFARSFAPEIDLYSVAVLDSNGNLILRLGRYGNVDDGTPLAREGGPPAPRPIGGDEVALFCGHYVGVATDRRVLVADPGNARILSVKLDYHVTEKVALKDAAEKK